MFIGFIVLDFEVFREFGASIFRREHALDIYCLRVETNHIVVCLTEGWNVDILFLSDSQDSRFGSHDCYCCSCY